MTPDAGTRRKLTAILSADVVGYSRLMGQDERATVHTLKTYRAAIGQLVERHHGRVVNAPGDALLAEFPSAVEAVQSAVEIQGDLKERNALLPAERQMRYRIGVNLGDVLEEIDGTLYGDGVNVAARLEAVAEADGICVSGKVFEEVEGKVDVGFDFVGEQEVKNISKPVRMYRVRTDGQPRARTGRAPFILGRRRARLIAAAVVIVLIGGGAVWHILQARLRASDPVFALPSGPSIAVLPFDNVGGDPQQEYFVDGITEDIISALARFDLRVIARKSAFQYKGRAVDVREVGGQLGARYVLEGSVRRAGGRIRVSAQLLDASTGASLWAQNFDRELTASSIFRVQDELTSRVVAAIAQPHGGVISLVGAKASAGKDTDSLSAYDCVLQAYEYWRIEGTAKKHLEVRACLERTVQEYSKYSQAWAMLADNYIQEFQTNRNRRADWLDRASRAAHRAVDLDPNNYAARYALAHVYFFQRDLQRFFAEADRALELNPHDPTYLAWLGVLTAYAGKWQRGLALADKSVKLNPDYPSWLNYLWFHDHYRKGEYQQALEKMLKVVRLEPGNFWPHVHLAQAYARVGHKEDAAAEVKKLLDVYPDFAKDARAQWKAWNWTDENTEAMLNGLRKAGLDIPDGP
jgi:adenylate cyclase